MINTLLGTKKNMTSTYDSRGRRVGATVVEISPNWVTQINSNSIQLGYGTKKSVKKPQLGHTKKIGIDKAIRWFREVPTSPRLRGASENDIVDFQPGTEIKLDQVFSIGDAVRVSGISKGKGFQGGVKRWGFHGGPKTHGQSDRHRAPGSIGTGTTPGRVLKGKKMAGHMGNIKASARNLEIVGIEKQKNLLTIKGAVPGFNSNLVMITKLGRVKGYTPPPEEKPEESEQETGDSGQPKTEEPVVEQKEGQENAES